MTKSSNFGRLQDVSMEQKSDELDVIIIGGGAAGLSSALWCVELGLSVAIFEKEGEFGGQLLRTFNTINNYPGAPAVSGKELRDTFLQQLGDGKITRFTGTAVTSADLDKKIVVPDGGRAFEAAAIVIATGVRRRLAGVPGESEFRGTGVLDSGVVAQHDLRGARLLIVGGGDAALDNALLLSRTAAHVTLVHRREQFSARESFVEAMRQNDNIEFLPARVLTAIRGRERVERVEVEDLKTGDRTVIPVDAVLIRIGVQPNTELFRGQLKTDDAGYILVDAEGKTSAPGVYAIGDVANPISPTISTAVGTGATAAKSIASNRVAKI